MLLLLFVAYMLLCIGLYFFQEKLIFFPERLDKNFKFSFNQPFEEITIKTAVDKTLNAVLFHSDSSKGLVFYLHGNAGSINSWGEVASRYTSLHYDVFMLDYPGYGKSDGSINSQSQLFNSIQTCYDEMKKRYQEARIVVLGYSIGTGPAAKLASVNHPKLLVLEAPYYNLKDLMRHKYPIVPTFLLKYNFQTNKYLKDCKMPVILFHGDADEVIYYGSSLKLKNEFKKGDTLITLKGQLHNGISDNLEYLAELKSIL